MYKIRKLYLSLFLVFSLFLTACSIGGGRGSDAKTYTLASIPEFSDQPYVELHGNQPDFSNETRRSEAFEEYSELDAYGRCGQAYANICKELMPTEEREAIGMVKPAGWHTVKYDIVDGKYLYNRCHLIGFQLAGENANKKNLITGTRYMNVDGMLPFENEVADYVKDSGNHVFYRVTPVYDGDSLLAYGVEMEAWSVEDDGRGVCFDVFVYNSQPGITIDYETGESWLSGEGQGKKKDTGEKAGGEQDYILNTSTHKFHTSGCDSVKEMKAKNKDTYKGDREDLIERGYSPCSRCKP